MKNFFFFLILFIVFIIGIVIFFFYRENLFSKGILRLEILGPDTVKVGEEIEYTVKYKNNGNFVLENPKLVFYLPDNSLTEDGKMMLIQELDDIYPGAQDSAKFKARLLGNDEELKTAKALLSYNPKNITATYESSTTFITKLDSTPITLDFDLPTKVEQGKNLQYAINYFSNVDYPLENLGIRIEPVQGFDFTSADPPSLDGLEWKLQTISKAQGGRINITGNILAESGQNLIFSASLGMWQQGRFIVVKKVEAEVQIIQPLLSIWQQVNGSSSYVASPEETLNYQIFFRNIGSTAFNDLFIASKIDSNALDMATIQIFNGGQLQPGSNMIVWDSSQTSELRRLGVQQQGAVSFSVKVKGDWVPSGADGTVINNEVNISQITQKFSVKVNSGLVISQTAYYKDDNIENSGPTPPEVGKATTYAVSWEIKNYFSDARNTKVRATLPEGVSLTGKILPEFESSNFSFDSVSREIVWSAGDILAGTGVNGDPIFLSFQVSLTPSLSQKGLVAPLIGQVQVSGENQFTNTIIIAQDSGINTSLPDDFTNSGGGIVQ